MIKIYGLALLLTSLLYIQADANLIVNGNFEKGLEGWSGNSENSTKISKVGRRAATVVNDNKEWAGIEQTIILPKNTDRVILSGWMKVDTVYSVKGKWPAAAITLNFLDRSGKQIGDYPDAAGESDIAIEWTHFHKYYYTRPNTAKITVACEMYNLTGKALFDDIRLIAVNRAGDTLSAESLSGPTDEGKWYAIDSKNSASGSHFVNWSSLLDAPAGKHGFLTVKGDQFVFEDGTVAKFFGTVLVAPYMFRTNRELDSLTKRISMMGYNIIRLHHMDADWAEPNIFGNTKTTRVLSEKMLDRVDYLIASAKKRGIYIFLDMVDHRDFKKADGVDDKLPELGGKQAGYFSKKIIELQKEFVRNLMTHKNSYTKLTYQNEPAIVLSEYINETTLFTNFGGDLIYDTPYRKELETLWKDAGNRGKLASFTLDYSNNRGVLRNQIEGADVKKSINFMMGVETSYFNTMNALFDSLNIKIPVCGSNMPLPILAMVKSNSVCSYMANDAYWDHPKLWEVDDDWDRVKYAPIDNSSQLIMADNNSFEQVCYYKVEGKPFVMWGNHSYPNEYQLEKLPIATAYASLQGYNGFLLHDFDHTPLGSDSLESFTSSRQPEDVAMSVIAAPLFLKNYIKKAPGVVCEQITDEDILSKNSYSNFIDTHSYLPFVTRVSKSFKKSNLNSDAEKYRKFYDKSSGEIRSETGELTLNKSKGYLLINSEKVQGGVGNLKNRDINLLDISFKISNSHAAVFAVSADDKPLKNSTHFYVVAAGPSKMSGQKFNASRTALVKLGSLPILSQVIEGFLTFNSVTENIKITPRFADGSVGTPTIIKKGSGNKLDLSKFKTAVLDVKLY